MKLFSIPYYIDLEGKEINGVVLKPYHLKLLGIIIVHDRLGNGCFASTELLASETGLTTDTVKHARADLVKAGIIKVEKGKMGYIKSISVEEVVFRSEIDSKASVQSNTSKCSAEHQQVFIRSIASREATPVLNKNINKNTKEASSSADADSDEFIKDNSEFPFDEDVDVVSVKPTVNKNKSAKAGVIYSKVCDSLGIKKLKSDCAVARIRSLLDNGMTEKEIMDTVEWTKTDEFYSGGGVMSRLANDAIQKAQLAKVNNKQRRNNDNVESEVIF